MKNLILMLITFASSTAVYSQAKDSTKTIKKVIEQNNGDHILHKKLVRKNFLAPPVKLKEDSVCKKALSIRKG